MTFFIRAMLPTLAALLLASGCSVLPERTAKETFLLPPPDFTASERQESGTTLRVLTPHTESPLNGTRILVNPEGHVIQAYSGARWAKATPMLVRDYWLESLRQIGNFNAVVHETSDASSDLSLSSDLTVFQLSLSANQQNEAVVIIQADVQLLESESGKVWAARRFRIQQAASANPVNTLVSDFGSANRALAEALSNWLLEISREYSQETNQARPL